MANDHRVSGKWLIDKAPRSSRHDGSGPTGGPVVALQKEDDLPVLQCFVQLRL